MLDCLADRIHSTKRPHPVRVAIDGAAAAGQTMLADELVEPLVARGRPVIRASIDGFHRARAHRYRRGTDSPEGYFLDSFDHDAILANLLRPLGPGGSLRFRTAVFDHRSDRAASARERTARRRAVLVFDGVFLLRPELNDAWDFRVFLAADFDVTLRRAVQRDQALFGGRGGSSRATASATFRGNNSTWRS